MNSDLGRVVRAIISELERSIPQIAATEATVQSSSTSSSSSSTTTPTTQQVANNLPSNPNQNSSSFYSLPDLSSLSIEELSRLDNDPTYLSDFVEESTVMQCLHKQVDDLLDTIETISGKNIRILIQSQLIYLFYIKDENLSKKTQLEELHQATELSRDTMRTLGDRYEHSTKSYQERTEQFAPHHIRVCVRFVANSLNMFTTI